MSIEDELRTYILIFLYAGSWFCNITFIQFLVLYISVFYVIFAELQYEKNSKSQIDKEAFYSSYLSNLWLTRLALLLLFWDLFQNHEVTFGFGLLVSILFSFGIVALTLITCHFKIKLDKAEI